MAGKKMYEMYDDLSSTHHRCMFVNRYEYGFSERRNDEQKILYILCEMYGGSYHINSSVSSNIDDMACLV